MSKLKSLEELFAGRHFDREVIILCVRWYLRYKLSLRDLVEMMAERGLQLAHRMILRWVRRYAPEFIKRWNRFGRGSGRSWRVDETYIKVRGRWVYLYRAVDKAGNTVDFRLSDRRNVAAAKAFFNKAIRHQGHALHTITLDGYAASHRAVREIWLNRTTAASNPELVPCSVSRTSTPPPSPLPESNCFTVSTRDSSHPVDSNSKIKHRRRSGTQS